MKFDDYKDHTEDFDSYDDDDEDYDLDDDKISEDDAKYLKEFQESMLKDGLSKKTIQKHLDNVEFFLYNYLLGFYDDGTMQSGLHRVDSFLGDWFIRKATWSSVNSIKENITSFKKFYKCMMENNNISKEQYHDFLEMIKENKEHWFEKMRDYDKHLDQDFDEDWYMDWLFR